MTAKYHESNSAFSTNNLLCVNFSSEKKIWDSDSLTFQRSQTCFKLQICPRYQSNISVNSNVFHHIFQRPNYLSYTFYINVIFLTVCKQFVCILFLTYFSKKHLRQTSLNLLKEQPLRNETPLRASASYCCSTQ